MPRLKYTGLLFLFAVVLAMEIGCSTTGSDDKVGTMPWDRAQDWENSQKQIPGVPFSR